MEVDCEYAYDISARDVDETFVAASGVEAYRSWISVRPKSMTGRVAYTGMRANRGKCLQQWAYAPRCETVA